MSLRLLRYIFVPLTFFLVYTVFSFFLGQNGMFARRHLERERLRVSANETTLENINAELVKTRESLDRGGDSLLVYARRLGYGRSDERFVRIMGLSIAGGNDMPTGKVIYSVDPPFVPNKRIAIVSTLFSLIVLGFFLINDLREWRESGF